METHGSLEDQLASLQAKTEEILKKREDLKKIEKLASSLEEQLILENKFTNHSALSLTQQWDQLNVLAMRLQNNLKQQIQAKNQSGVSEESLKEFTMMFKHFDKDKSGRLNHKDFKSCMRALGYDLPVVDEGEPDVEFEEILNAADPYRSGNVYLHDYIAYMISKETENISSTEDMINAFKSITSDRPYITIEELNSVCSLVNALNLFMSFYFKMQNFTKDKANFCVRHMKPYVDKTGREINDAYDFIEFTNRMFSWDIIYSR